jgi:hypothetical protein
MVECRPALDAVSLLRVRCLPSANTGSSSNRIDGARTALRRAPAIWANTPKHTGKSFFLRTEAQCGEVGLARSAELDDAAEVVVKTAPAFMKHAGVASRGNARLCRSTLAGVFRRDDFYGLEDAPRSRQVFVTDGYFASFV